MPLHSSLGDRARLHLKKIKVRIVTVTSTKKVWHVHTNVKVLGKWKPTL